MDASDLFKNMVVQKNLGQEAWNSKNLEIASLIEEEAAGKPLNGERIDLAISTEGTGVILLSYLSIAAGGLIIFRLLHKREQEFPRSLSSRLNQFPCMNCHFFSTNPYLKCTANPVAVLTNTNSL